MLGKVKDGKGAAGKKSPPPSPMKKVVRLTRPMKKAEENAGHTYEGNGEGEKSIDTAERKRQVDEMASQEPSKRVGHMEEEAKTYYDVRERQQGLFRGESTKRRCPCQQEIVIQWNNGGRWYRPRK